MRPIVKWAGGKRRVLEAIFAHVPKTMHTYAEPFMGGAAVFLKLADHEKKKPFKKAILSDQNEDLVACYRVVRDSVEDLIEELGQYRYDKDLFYEVRARDPKKMTPLQRGARLLFLNRTCFNGLWRVNSKGIFNVPFGRYTNPKIVDAVALRHASKLLAGVDVRHGDFTGVTRDLVEDDFVYLDPPYVPVSKTSDFTAYAQEGFGADDQLRLANELKTLRDRGVRALLSNADTKESRALYRDFKCEIVRVSRLINANADERGDVGELLVTNWRPAKKTSKKK